MKGLFEKADTKKGDAKPADENDAKNVFAILHTQVAEKVNAEVSKHSYKYLRSQCANLNLGGKGTMQLLRKRLETYLIDERFKQQLKEFERQINAHTTDENLEEFFDLNEALKDFKDNFVEI